MIALDSSANMEWGGFMTNTAADHQGTIKMFRLHFQLTITVRLLYISLKCIKILF